jgi:hypothetical protein
MKLPSNSLTSLLKVNLTIPTEQIYEDIVFLPAE